MEYVLVALALVVLDFISAEYTRAIAIGRVLASGLYACSFTAASMFLTVEIVNQPLLALAAGAGAFVGTTASVLLANRRA
jgi:hypothetical protein